MDACFWINAPQRCAWQKQTKNKQTNKHRFAQEMDRHHEAIIKQSWVVNLWLERTIFQLNELEYMTEVIIKQSRGVNLLIKKDHSIQPMYRKCVQHCHML